MDGKGPSEELAFKLRPGRQGVSQLKWGRSVSGRIAYVGLWGGKEIGIKWSKEDMQPD